MVFRPYGTLTRPFHELSPGVGWRAHFPMKLEGEFPHDGWSAIACMGCFRIHLIAIACPHENGVLPLEIAGAG